MSEFVEFGTKAVADDFRDRHAEHVCPLDDDRRLKTVAFKSDTPTTVLEQAAVEAASGRSERAAGAGQVELSDVEKNRVGPFTGSNNLMKARSAKAILLDHGVDDWTAYYDGDLTVDEHRELADRAAREGGGERLDAERSVDDRLGDAEKQTAGACDHAKGHCEHGETDACEFLKESCGYDDEEIQSILTDFEGAAQEIEGKARGALRRSWHGIYGATDEIEAAIATAREQWDHAIKAQRAINAIRARHGQEPIEHIELIEDVHDRIDQLAGRADDDCLPRHLHVEAEAGEEQRDAAETGASDQSEATGLQLVDDRDQEDVDDDQRPTEFEEQSREFRAAQSDGYLRKGQEQKEASDRDGLGQFGARPSDTKGLEQFEEENEA